MDEETGEVRWVATEVNLDDHVVVPKLESNIESPDMFVEDYIASLTNPKLDKSKPLWDLHILNIKTSESEGVIVYRIHHSIGDGMSIMSLLLACSRKVSDPTALPTIPEVRKSSQKKKIGFWEALQLIWNTVVGVILFVATSLFLKDTKTPLKGPVGGENNPRRVLKLTTSLDDVKLVKNAMNATINDVVLAVTEAGLSRYLNRRYGELENDKGPMKWKNYIPKNIRLRAIFYVNIRPAAGLQDLVAMMDKGSPARWGNKIGYVLLPFNIGLREDPLDYIHQAKAAINRKKASLESLFAYIFTKFLIKFFGSKVAGHLNYKVFCNTTLWFSNVPGTGDEIAFCGHELAYYAPTC
ncbi:WSD1 family O-acyltransferase, partial [Klebsiella pneumoniae]